MSIGNDLGDHPTAENLEPYFSSNKELLEKLKEDKSSKFLSILGISTAQIMLAAQDPATKHSINNSIARLLLATNIDAEELGRLAELYQNSALKSKLDEAFNANRNVKRNQTIGKMVENIIRELLREELKDEETFRVSEVPQSVGGSDILVEIDSEFDFMTDDFQPISIGVQVGQKSFRIEVKSARANFVRMTTPQANEAISESRSHIVCIVEIPENFDNIDDMKKEEVVRGNALFLFNIGPKLSERFKKAQEFQKLTGEIKGAPRGDVMIEIVQGGQIRVRLNKEFWTNGEVRGVGFEEFVDMLTRKDVASNEG